MLTAGEIDSAPVIDGRLDDQAWRQAGVADRFWVSEQQRWPSEQTEVLVVADRDAIYFGFRVFDSMPDRIAAMQTRRDGALGYDDQVSVEIDPFLSYKEISKYSVSAIGTQSANVASGRAQQTAWKGDWQAAVARTEYGWSAEIAIPYEILNFAPGVNTIGVNFLRFHNRTGESSRWSDVTVQFLPELMGQLVGLRPESAGKTRPWTFLPYVLVGRNIANRKGEVRDRVAAAGADIRYEPRPNLTGMISLLPDFSQIESAITSIDFSYNEKERDETRPFFKEGASYFGDDKTQIYFYSVRVPNFDTGAKVFGRVDGTQFGALMTKAQDGRSDLAVNVGHQFARTHNVVATLVATDRPDLRSALVAMSAKGRAASGFSYGVEGAATKADTPQGDGKFAGVGLGWQADYWTVGVKADGYGRYFRPDNGLLKEDLPDTEGRIVYGSYARELAEGAIREAKIELSFEERYTWDGRLQRRKSYATGSVELREPQVRLTLSNSDGPYRPVGDEPGQWADELNPDHYWTTALDFNTRSSHFGFGAALSSGVLARDDYRYAAAYVWARPVRTVYIGLTIERLRNFGSFDQAVVNANWDITPQHSLAARAINAYYGDSFRVAYVWRIRKDVDFFFVYDYLAGAPTALSGKVVMTF